CDYTVRLDWPFFAFAAGVMIFVGIGVGLFPAWRAARADLRGGLSNIGRGTTLDLATRRWLSGLIIVELYIAAVVRVGFRTIGRARTRDLAPRRWLSGLIIVELAIAAVLLVGSLSLTQYFRQ